MSLVLEELLGREEYPRRRSRLRLLPEFEAVLAEECKRVLPRGKGMFVGALEDLEKHRKMTPEDFAKRVRDMGLSWLAIQRIWQYRPPKRSKFYNPPKKLREYLDVLRETDEHFPVWLWGFPHPKRIDEFVSSLVDLAIEVGAQGVIADPEAPWLWGSYSGESEELMDELLDQAHQQCLSVGITSYPRPTKRKKFPCNQFSRADFGLPQAYTEDPATSVKEWKDQGFKVIIPLLSSVREPDEMKDKLTKAPMPDCAVGWWSWLNTTTSKRWNVIRGATLPMECAPPRWPLPSDYSCVRPRVGPAGSEFELGGRCALVPIAALPTPGQFYTIKAGIDSRGLEDLAGRAYGVSKGRIALAQRINNHSYNRRFWRSSAASPNYPQGRISFNPRFSSDIRAQADAQGTAPSGHAFATIFIPGR